MDAVVLSERQRRVLWLVSTGRTRDEIATVLGCSSKAVRGTCERTMRALGASNAAHAVAIGLLTGHIGPYEDCGLLAAYRRHIKRNEAVCAACKRGNRERTEMEAQRQARPQLTDAQVRLLRALNAGRSHLQIRQAWNVSERTLEGLITSTYALLGVDRLAPSLRREAALREARVRGLLGVQLPSPVAQSRQNVRLSNTQVRILLEVENGATVTETAERLGIGRNACGSRLSEAYQRLGVAWMDKADRRAEAIRRARAAGLLPARAGV